MKKIKFNGEKFTLPESWSEISFQQLKQIKQLKADTTDYEYELKILSILTGIRYEDILLRPKAEVDAVINTMHFIDEDEAKAIQQFKIGSEVFHVSDFKEDVTDAFVTYKQYEQQYIKQPFEDIPFKLAIMCRKEGESYKDVEPILAERAAFFAANIDALTVMRLNAFFLLRKKAFQLHSQAFLNLKTQVAKQKENLEQHFLKDTVGWHRFSGWHKVMLLRFSLYLIRSFHYFSTTSIGRKMITICSKVYSICKRKNNTKK